MFDGNTFRKWNPFNAVSRFTLHNFTLHLYNEGIRTLSKWNFRVTAESVVYYVVVYQLKFKCDGSQSIFSKVICIFMYLS